jgi:hypothetical protein
MMLKEKENLIEGIALFVKDQVKEAVAPLKAKIAELEALPKLKYRGIWDDKTEYREGNFVTHHGSIWHCNARSTGRMPGASDDWVLAVKRGRDSKE